MTPSRFLAAALLAGLAACSTARDPARGFRLAGTGDVHRCREALLNFQCSECHSHSRGRAQIIAELLRSRRINSLCRLTPAFE